MSSQTVPPKKSIQMIAALDPNRAIGKQWTLPRDYPADLKFFKRTTLDCPIVMGRGTYESIWRPLPKRTNIILSSSLQLEDCPWCILFRSIPEIINRYEEEYSWNRPLMIIWWATLYEQFLWVADTLILTKIPEVVSDADSWFPRYDTHYVCTDCEVLDGESWLIVETWKLLE